MEPPLPPIDRIANSLGELVEMIRKDLEPAPPVEDVSTYGERCIRVSRVLHNHNVVLPPGGGDFYGQLIDAVRG